MKNLTIAFIIPLLVGCNSYDSEFMGLNHKMTKSEFSEKIRELNEEKILKDGKFIFPLEVESIEFDVKKHHNETRLYYYVEDFFSEQGLRTVMLKTGEFIKESKDYAVKSCDRMSNEFEEKNDLIFEQIKHSYGQKYEMISTNSSQDDYYNYSQVIYQNELLRIDLNYRRKDRRSDDRLVNDDFQGCYNEVLITIDYMTIANYNIIQEEIQGRKNDSLLLFKNGLNNI